MLKVFDHPSFFLSVFNVSRMIIYQNICSIVRVSMFHLLWPPSDVYFDTSVITYFSHLNLRNFDIPSNHYYVSEVSPPIAALANISHPKRHSIVFPAHHSVTTKVACQLLVSQPLSTLLWQALVLISPLLLRKHTHQQQVLPQLTLQF